MVAGREEIGKEEWGGNGSAQEGKKLEIHMEDAASALAQTLLMSNLLHQSFVPQAFFSG